MLKPKLRPLESFPLQHQGESMVGLRDPQGLSDQVAVLPRLAVVLLSLCDGERSVAEVAAEFRLRTGVNLPEQKIHELLAQLDQALLLDTPRFDAHQRAVHQAFRAGPTRSAAHAGDSYPDGARELGRYLDQQALRTTGPGRPARRGAGGPEVRALISPHIDFHRGGGAYAHAWRPLIEAETRPDLVIVFGTDHTGIAEPFTLTHKSYDTPLGPVPTDQATVTGLARAFGPRVFAEELHHRREHSIEFQAVWLRHVYGDDCPPMVPILCGSLHELVETGADPARDGDLERFYGALTELCQGRRVLVIAGADLAHVGPRFGDPAAFRAPERAEVKRLDDQAMAAATRGDARGFFRSVAAVGDQHRVCGLAPIYATLRVLDGLPGRAQGETVAYDQCAADDDGGSFVSIASVVYR